MPSQTSAPPPSWPPRSPLHQVAVYDGRDTYTTAPLDCSGITRPGGSLTLPGKGLPVTCTYSATGLSLSDAAAVLPIIIPSGASTPAPASPVPYVASSGARRVTGDCANIGTSLQLMLGDRRAQWQPAFEGQAFGGAADCEGGDTQRFALWFGGDAQGAPVLVPCGDYYFDGVLTLVPANGDAVVSEATFAVKVTDCRRR